MRSKENVDLSFSRALYVHTLYVFVKFGLFSCVVNFDSSFVHHLVSNIVFRCANIFCCTENCLRDIFVSEISWPSSFYFFHLWDECVVLVLYVLLLLTPFSSSYTRPLKQISNIRSYTCEWQEVARSYSLYPVYYARNNSMVLKSVFSNQPHHVMPPTALIWKLANMTIPYGMLETVVPFLDRAIEMYSITCRRNYVFSTSMIALIVNAYIIFCLKFLLRTFIFS